MGLLHRWWREGNRKHILGRGRDVSSKTLAIAMAKTGEYEHYEEHGVDERSSLMIL